MWRRRTSVVHDSSNRAKAGGARRRAYFGPEHGWLDTPVLQREALQEAAVEGPVIIEQYDTTIVLSPGSRAAFDAQGNIVIDLAVGTRLRGADRSPL